MNTSGAGVRRAVGLLAVLSLVSTASAADWYVDVALGNDAHSGSSPVSAWRTISHAVQVLSGQPPGEHTIHIAPGVYSPLSGESFPLRPPPGVLLVGDGGASATTLDALGSQLLLTYYSSPTNGWRFDANSGARGLRLIGAGYPLSVVAADFGPAAPSFRDLVIEGAQFSGVGVDAVATDFGSGAGAAPRLERVEIRSCGEHGVSVNAYAEFFAQADARVELVDVRVSGCAGDALRLESAVNSSVRARVTRSRFTHCGGHGVQAINGSFYGTAEVDLFDSLIADNLGYGVWATSGTPGGGVTRLDGCTLARNQLGGFRLDGAWQGGSIANSIFAGHTLDLPGLQLGASWSCSANGEFAGSPTCIAADPQFVDADAHDYRLRWGSPCIDRGGPQALTSLDLAGRPRNVDGDLDTVLASDMGALEFETLALHGTPRLGAVLDFEISGAPGAHSLLLMSRSPLGAAQATPFGEFGLQRARIVGEVWLPLGAAQPFVLQRRVGLSPSLVGATFAFQCLTDSSAAPLGRALSNPISLVVLP